MDTRYEDYHTNWQYNADRGRENLVIGYFAK